MARPAKGRMILSLGVGTEDVRLLKLIRDSGYWGTIGVLNHADQDAEERLLDNLDRLEWTKHQLNGAPATSLLSQLEPGFCERIEIEMP